MTAAVFVPFRAPQAPKPEPEATVRFGDIEIRLTLTYLHHLRNCGGWGDRASSFCDSDQTMSRAMHDIERAMWNASDHPPMSREEELEQLMEWCGRELAVLRGSPAGTQMPNPPTFQPPTPIAMPIPSDGALRDEE